MRAVYSFSFLSFTFWSANALFYFSYNLIFSFFRAIISLAILALYNAISFYSSSAFLSSSFLIVRAFLSSMSASAAFRMVSSSTVHSDVGKDLCVIACEDLWVLAYKRGRSEPNSYGGSTLFFRGVRIFIYTGESSSKASRKSGFFDYLERTLLYYWLSLFCGIGLISILFFS